MGVIRRSLHSLCANITANAAATTTATTNTTSAVPASNFSSIQASNFSSIAVSNVSSVDSAAFNISSESSNFSSVFGANFSSIFPKAPLAFIAVAKDLDAANNASYICTNIARDKMDQEGSLDALLYIVVVLLFYAFSIVVLMIKYIRRENREAYLRRYFEEFVSRDKFQTARIRNQIHVLQMKNAIEKNSHSRSLGLGDQQAQQMEAGVLQDEKKAHIVMDSIPETEEDTIPETEDETEGNSETAYVKGELLARRETPV